MEITEVKVFPVREEKVKAFVSIILDRCFMVNDIKIIQGRDGLFISMPSRRKRNGKFKDVAHPLNNETRGWMEQRILGEYERTISGGEESAGPPAGRADPKKPAEAEKPAEAPRPAQAAERPREARTPRDEKRPTDGKTPAEAPPRAERAPAPRDRDPRRVDGNQTGGAGPSAPEPEPAPAQAPPPQAAPADSSSAPPQPAAVAEPSEPAEAEKAAKPPKEERTLEEVAEEHLRDSFWTT